MFIILIALISLYLCEKEVDFLDPDFIKNDIGVFMDHVTTLGKVSYYINRGRNITEPYKNGLLSPLLKPIDNSLRFADFVVQTKIAYDSVQFASERPHYVLSACAYYILRRGR